MIDPLLVNARIAIQLGVEDYQALDARRALSAVRNIAAGVLLVFKEKLRAMSPDGTDEVLLKERVNPVLTVNGTLKFVGVGSKTVDVQSIKERFRALHVKADWKRVDALLKARNELEHYHSNAQEHQLRQLIADAFFVLRSFLTEELQLEPVEFLGEPTLRVLLNEATVYGEQLKSCRDKLKAMNWPLPELLNVIESIRCASCGSELVKPELEVERASDRDANNAKYRCTACGNLEDYEDTVEDATAEAFGAAMHIALAEGGDPPLEQCLECGRFTFHVPSNICLVCLDEPSIKECLVCGETLSREDASLGSLCSDHRWVSERERDR